jgi:5-hydroxyisourate hydrolase
MKSISTHILDISRGKPAAGVPVILEYQSDADFAKIAEGKTDSDGRIRDWQFDFKTGTYRLHFKVDAYFTMLGEKAFYPYVEIVFTVESAEQHYHVPLLLSPFGYSTYRGS